MYQLHNNREKNVKSATFKGANASFFTPSTVIQKKLQVGASNDQYEVEADTMADKVMRMNVYSNTITVSQKGSLIQRKCAACEDEEKIRRKPLADSIQRFSGSTNEATVASTPIENSINSSKGGGMRMDDSTRDFMESRFGAEFTNVRIHTGNNAVQMSRALNAQAFTVGNDIYFNEGKYSPSTSSGKHLLAHELTHTIQQRGTIARKIQRSPGSPAGGCGLCHGGPQNAGTQAHRIIQLAMVRQYPMLEVEAPLLPSPGDNNGFLDLLYINGNNVMIGEIKPANSEGLVRGEADLQWYATQIRAVLGNHLIVSRMILPPPLFSLSFPTLAPSTCPQVQQLYVMPPVNGLYTYYCEPDYSVLIRECDCRRGRRVPQEVPVRVPRTQTENERMQRLATFVQQLVHSGENVAVAVRRFLMENRDLINFVLVAGVAVLIALVGKDILTWGTTIVADFVVAPIVATLTRIAFELRGLALN